MGLPSSTAIFAPAGMNGGPSPHFISPGVYAFFLPALMSLVAGFDEGVFSFFILLLDFGGDCAVDFIASCADRVNAATSTIAQISRIRLDIDQNPPSNSVKNYTRNHR